MGGTENTRIESPQASAVRAELNNVAPREAPSEPWRPPVDLSHLSTEQQQLVEKMLFEESAAFARDSSDIG